MESNINNHVIVQSISERNTIPCENRVNGMIVTVIGTDLSYNQYMLKGGDPCVNTNWKPHGLTLKDVNETVGHETITDMPEQTITSLELNTRFPNAKEGFKVTYTKLNSTFMKIFSDVWVMSNNIQI